MAATFGIKEFRVRINDRDLAAEFGALGSVGRVAREDALLILGRAEQLVPKGGLRSVPSLDRFRPQAPLLGSHRTRVVPSNPGVPYTQYFVENTSSHAAAVHEGTAPIVSYGRRMVIDMAGHSFDVNTGKKIRRSFRVEGRKHQPKPIKVIPRGVYIRGQGPNPWLKNATEYVLRGKYG